MATELRQHNASALSAAMFSMTFWPCLICCANPNPNPNPKTPNPNPNPNPNPQPNPSPNPNLTLTLNLTLARWLICCALYSLVHFSFAADSRLARQADRDEGAAAGAALEAIDSE